MVGGFVDNIGKFVVKLSFIFVEIEGNYCLICNQYVNVVFIVEGGFVFIVFLVENYDEILVLEDIIIFFYKCGQLLDKLGYIMNLMILRLIGFLVYSILLYFF